MKKLLFTIIITTLTMYAQTFNVSTTSELRTALDTAATNGESDTIILADGVYKTTDDGVGTFIYLSDESHSLTLQGSHMDNVLLSGDNQHQIFNHRSSDDALLTVDNLSFIDANNTVDGGGAIYTDFTLRVYNCKFTSNRSISNGGAIYFVGTQDSSIYLENSFFENNSAHDGAGFYVQSSYSSTTVIGSTFINNNASGNGGAFFNNYGYYPVNVIDSIFTNNSSSESGGAIHASVSSYTNSSTGLTISNSIFSGNSSVLDGAGLFFIANHSSFANISNSLFLNNSTNDTGGAIYLKDQHSDASLTVSSTLFASNSSAVETTGSSISILAVNSIFYDNNNLDVRGGGIGTFKNNYINSDNILIDKLLTDNIFSGATVGFVDPINGDYQLTESSSLVDAGNKSISGISYPTTDLSGSSRVVGGNIDIGPYELSTTRPTINSISYTGIAKEFSELTFSVDYNLTAGRTISTVEYDYLNDGSYTTTSVYTFNTAGTYKVNVKVTDSDGEYSSTYKTITIAELPYSEMTYEQKLVKTIDPVYYDDIVMLIDTDKESARLSGITVGENNVVLAPSDYNLVTQAASDVAVADMNVTATATAKVYIQDNPSEFNLVTKSDIDLTAANILALSTGWTLTSTPFDITDLSIFDSAIVVWVYDNFTSAWSAYSPDATMRQKITDNSTVSLITTIPVGSGIWIQK